MKREFLVRWASGPNKGSLVRLTPAGEDWLEGFLAKENIYKYSVFEVIPRSVSLKTVLEIK